MICPHNPANAIDVTSANCDVIENKALFGDLNFNVESK